MRNGGPDPSDEYCRTSRATLVWADETLTAAAVLHEAGCRRIENASARCGCRSASDRIPAGTVVAVAKRTGEAALVIPDGHGAVWVEVGSLKVSRRPPAPPRTSTVPDDYADAATRMSEGKPLDVSDRTPAGGELVAVSGGDGRVELWRYVGRVFQADDLVALLVDPTLPLQKMFDAPRSAVTTAPRARVRAVGPGRTRRGR